MHPEIAIYSAGAIRRGIDAVTALLLQNRSILARLVYGSAPKTVDRLRAGERPDIVIVPDTSLDALERENRIMSGSRTAVGKSKMAIVLRKGAPLRDFSSKAKFTTELLNADLVVHNEGSSGAAAASLIDDIGIRGQLGERLKVVANSREMMKLVTQSAGTVIGLAQGTNALDHIARGAEIAIHGHFPDEVGRVTTYQAAMLRGGVAEHDALAFLDVLASPAGRELLHASGLTD